MLTGISILMILLLFFSFFIFYKKKMIIKMFTLNMAEPASEFAHQLERTAESAVNRLEDRVAHLDILLEEADSKIRLLSQELERANTIIDNLKRIEPEKEERNLDETLEQPRLGAQDRSEAFEQPKHVLRNDHETAFSEKHRIIFAMAEQGYSVTEIAKATGMGKGEIMLLLQLNKK